MITIAICFPIHCTVKKKKIKQKVKMADAGRFRRLLSFKLHHRFLHTMKRETMNAHTLRNERFLFLFYLLTCYGWHFDFVPYFLYYCFPSSPTMMMMMMMAAAASLFLSLFLSNAIVVLVFVVLVVCCLQKQKIR